MLQQVAGDLVNVHPVSLGKSYLLVAVGQLSEERMNRRPGPWPLLGAFSPGTSQRHPFRDAENPFFFVWSMQEVLPACMIPTGMARHEKKE